MLDINQQIGGNNSGVQAGIYVEGSNSGKVTIETLTQIQIFNGTRYEVTNYRRNNTKSPFKYLSPYTPADTEIFFGRQDETANIVQKIGNQDLLVVFGDAGVGKTSLLAAGVMPQLAQNNYTVISLRNYQTPEETIYRALKANQAALDSGELSELSSLPEQLKSLLERNKRQFVLVFDQFELLFHPSIKEENRDIFIEKLSQALKISHSGRLKMIFVMRKDAFSEWGHINTKLPDLLNMPCEIGALNMAAALEAIAEPLNRPDIDVIYVDNNIAKTIVEDLIKVYREDVARGSAIENSQCVYPPHLQIVCETLFKEAKAPGKSHTRKIDKNLYHDELKGAKGILVSYIDRNIKSVGGDESLTVSLLSAMSRRQAARWMTAKAESFGLREIEDSQISETLDNLVKAQILKASYNADDEIIYSFVNSAVPSDIRRWLNAEQKLNSKEKVKDELDRIWFSWLSNNIYASRKQLRYLKEHSDDLTANSIAKLILLRSAVQLGEPVKDWVTKLKSLDKQLNSDNTESLIRSLQLQTQINDDGNQPSETDLAYARKIVFETVKNPENNNQSEGITETDANPRLGGDTLSDINDSPNQSVKAFSTEEQNEGYKSLSVVAATHSNPTVRQVCSLSLAVLGNDEAVGLIDTAVRNNNAGKWRRAELLGILAEAGITARKDKKIYSLNKCLIWAWRAWRNILLNRHRLLILLLGGGIGTGFAVGMFNAFFQQQLGNNSGLLSAGPTFAFGFLVGGLIGAVVAFGMALGIPLSLTSLENRVSSYPFERNFAPNLKSFVVAVFLTAFLFAIGQYFFSWLAMLSPFDHRAPSMFMRGLLLVFLLSIMFLLQPFKGKFSNGLNYIFPIIVIGMIFAVIQGIFVAPIDPAKETLQTVSTIVYGRDISLLGRAFGEVDTFLWMRLLKWVFSDWKSFVVFDAGLFGGVMVLGLKTGLYCAEKILPGFQKMSEELE